ncbi:MAG: tetratricopeptide repeat protein [Pseudomonadota bacterium]
MEAPPGGDRRQPPGNEAARHLQSAVAAFTAGDIDTAEAAFSEAERAADGADDTATVAYNVGVFLRRTGRPADAVARFDQAVAVRPSTAAWVERALALVELGLAKDAAGSLDRALVLAPNDGDARRARARVRFRLGDWAGCLDDLAAHGPNDADDALLLVRALFEAGRADEAWALVRTIGGAAPNLAGDLLKATTRRARGGFALDERRLAVTLGLAPETPCDSPPAPR